MDDEKRTEEVLLKEYAEAGQACRQIEQLTRTSLSVFLTFATALTGYLLNWEANPGAKLGLSVAGCLISLLFLNTILRSQAYYLKYIGRAKEIEAFILTDGKPIMSLYTSGQTAPSGSGTFSNKTAIAFAIAVASVYFFTSAALYGYRLACHAGL